MSGGSAQRDIRVLHVSEPNDYGAARVVYNLARQMKGQGVESVVCTPSGPLAEWLHDIGIDTLELPFSRRSPPSYLRSIRALRRAVRQGEFTVVHAHSSFSGLLVRLGRTRRFPPVVFQPHAWSFLALHGVPRFLAVALERVLARRTDMFIFVSEEELRLARDFHIRCSPMAVVPNGIDFTLEGSRRVAPDPRTNVVIGCVGRLARQKGIDVLLRAVSSDHWPPCSSVEIIGDGRERAALKSLARSLGVADRVTFLGSDDDARARLKTWDLFVFPSRYEAGAALALLEAANEGLPIVTTDVAGARRLLGGDSARIVPVEDHHALASAVANAVSRWPETVEAGLRDRARAMAMFPLEGQMDQMRQVYASVTTPSRRGAKRGRLGTVRRPRPHP